MGASASKGRPLPLFLLICLATLAVDQVTKAVLSQNLTHGKFVPLIGQWVGVRLVHNAASAFGLVRAAWVPLVCGAVISAALLAYVARGALRRHPRLAVPLSLVLGGSLGNLVDRLRSGGVTDFIDFRVWPVFNTADAAITVGVALLAILVMRGRSPREVYRASL